MKDVIKISKTKTRTRTSKSALDDLDLFELNHNIDNVIHTITSLTKELNKMSTWNDNLDKTKANSYFLSTGLHTVQTSNMYFIKHLLDILQYLDLK